MRKQMLFPKKGDQGILSKEEPIKYEKDKKKIVLSRGIKEEEYDEVCDFLKEQNRMSSGNITLLPTEELQRYVRLEALVVLMRHEVKKSLIGTILSLPFPIFCMGEQITHCCTTFLNVHSKLRGMGMCMALIRELTAYGFSKNLFCSYFLTSFPLTETSFEISAWYRPLDLPKSIGLGFTYPNWNNISDFHKNRVKYNVKMPRKYLCERVKNCEKVYAFYQKIIQGKKFVFSPDLKYFQNWVNEYYTYMVKHNKKIVGIFSLSSVNCIMETGIEGKLALPLLFNSENEHVENVLKCCISKSAEDYDTLYVHNVGDLTGELLKKLNFLKTEKKSYFSLYNNSVELKKEDLYIPLF